MTKNVPITYVDTWNNIVAHPNIINAVDIIAVNIYPFYQDSTISQALSTLQNGYHSAVAAANGKPVIISETGWPSSGNPPSTGSLSIPSRSNAVTYFTEAENWALSQNIPMFYFEAYDEAWKANYNDYSSWGIWEENGTLKPGMQTVFQG
jgi:GPH family glycoside/pentoside/hexuronide:cation symporter